MSILIATAADHAPLPRNARLNMLLAQRDLLETEADAIGSELRSPGANGEPPAGIKEPLVDKEGFPRGDIDIYRVRTLRGRLAVINTDHKELMKDIQKEVHALHQAAPAIISVEGPCPSREQTASSSSSSSSASAAIPMDAVSYNSLLAEVMTEIQPSSSELHSQYNHYGIIATLDQILPNSPASSAHLVDGMQLLAFGDIDVSSSGSASAALQRIPDVVRTAFQNEQALKLIVRCASRGPSSSPAAAAAAATGGAGSTNPPENTGASEIKRVFLKPQVWAGRGLLGMHLTPL